MKWIEELKALNPCSDAIEWIEANNFPTLKAAWDACERGDWMLWLWARTVEHESPEHKRLVLAACRCSRLALPNAREENRKALIEVIELVERWATEGGVEQRQLEAAWSARWSAEAAAEAVWSAMWSAEAAWSAAAEAAAAARWSAAAEAAEAARSDTLARCANIVRELQPEAPKIGN